MARPIKNNADYFAHDSGMRNDPKIKALRKKFGSKGYAVWCFMLEVLTDAENFQIEWDELNIELLSGDFDCETEDLVTIIEYCSKIKLLEIVNETLTCGQLRKRFEGLLSKRKKDRDKIIVSDNKDTIGDNPIFDSDNGIIDSVNTHSKVKESKEEDSKADIHAQNSPEIPPADPPKNPPKRRIKPFVAPTMEEVKSFFVKEGYRAEAGERAWKYYNDADWFDTEGKPVMIWKAKMRSNWFREENKMAASGIKGIQTLNPETAR